MALKGNTTMKRTPCLVFAALMLVAAMSQVGCATSALHGHLTNRDAAVAIRHAANGRPMLCADATTGIFDKTHWDTIMENWPLYLAATLLDVAVGYYVWKGMQEERDAAPVTYVTNNNPSADDAAGDVDDDTDQDADEDGGAE